MPCGRMHLDCRRDSRGYLPIARPGTHRAEVSSRLGRLITQHTTLRQSVEGLMRARPLPKGGGRALAPSRAFVLGAIVGRPPLSPPPGGGGERCHDRFVLQLEVRAGLGDPRGRPQPYGRSPRAPSLPDSDTTIGAGSCDESPTK
ncbi:hypothetical protein CURTO8I2_170148 [Curtobacterium sp. 8I-2]|nr:hypothetical protein CURTO8I2_170148 [Curtobacterium sp. 8I-2]